MDLGLSGRIAVVTGSSMGIGKAIADALLREDATVYITGRREDYVTLTVTDFREKYGNDRVKAFVGDLSREPALADMVDDVDAVHGGLDILVCNIGSGRSVPLLAEDDAEWRRMMEINLFSAASAVRAFQPLLEKQARPAGRTGSIVFVSSICGEEALGCPVAYSAAKSALNSYAANIARPLGKRNIRVNIVSPGNVIFPGSTWENKLAANRDAVEAMLEKDVPLGRLGTAEEIGDTVAFLASDRASFVTGADWIVDGGQTRRI